MTKHFALFGAGRIGRMHADILSSNRQAKLCYVYDINPAAAEAVAQQYQAHKVNDISKILADPEIDAVLIASSTDTHVDLITRSALAGKAILCEKPIDLDRARVEQCWSQIQHCQVPIQIGFNRRFDPSHKALADAVKNDEIGALELLILTSRDPAPPPPEYLQHSGGLFHDMMIHDFDLARFIMAEEPVEVFARASNKVDPQIAELGDVDTAMVTLSTASGTLCHINCSRRAVYGYDQRVEAFGAKGMLISDNHRPTSLMRYTASATQQGDPLLDFFIERYQNAYVAEINEFIQCITEQRLPAVDFQDGLRALILADAARQSWRTGQPVALT